MTSHERFAEIRSGHRERLVGARNEVVAGPVADWAADFSHLEPEWAADPYSIQADLRRRCPIAHTHRFGGAWLPTRYEDVAAIAYDTDRFSSRAILVGNVRPPPELAPVGVSPPISSDPPFHHGARKLLLPAFTAKAVSCLEERTRARCHALIDALEDREQVDAVVEYAQRIPTHVMAGMLGFPEEDERLLLEFATSSLERANVSADERSARTQRRLDYLLAQIHDHVDNPRDDLTTRLIEADLDGRKLDPLHISGTLSSLMIAGIDTTWSAIGVSLWHLARTPADRVRLVSAPGLLVTALEEFLRAYAPVMTGRLVKRDMRWRGVDMKAEDWVLMAFPAANRDPRQFDRADEIVLDRAVNRHIAFGLGIHRCIGSHLARMELRVALEVWLGRIPEFTLPDLPAVAWTAGQVRGPKTLPVRIGP
ncbi:cytochrome P450 [Amycolatopsis sp. MtRt-6]|uniref:cytochrome P450 n=1 Tax=Amycolatopsis sp. MtRt-6 TaxID=2792782 RepID=UPI001A8C13C9|nr:cytochrome P450 [Amycolatopsis sp. MtRt-6]